MSKSEAMGTVTIHTDGACQDNPGPGGFGAILKNDTEWKELAQGYQHTTNNRMELRGAIAGLFTLRRKCQVTIFTDSKYVCNAFLLDWVGNWIAKGWKNASKKPVKNQDLWEELLALVDQHEVTWKWVKGHAGHKENERADFLAGAAITKTALLPDEGPTTAITACRGKWDGRA